MPLSSMLRDASSPRRPDGYAQELLYRSLFEHALMEVHLWQLVRDDRGAIVTWRLVDANPAALASWGRTRDEVVGRTAEEIFPGAAPVEAFLPIVEEIMATGRPREWETPFDGTGQVLRMVSIPVGDGFVSTGFDVTADRRRQRELQDALLSLTQATRAGNVGLWDRDLRTDTVHYSDEWKRQLGYEPHEITSSASEFLSRIHPDDVAPVMARTQEALAHPETPADIVVRMRHKDGSYRWILAQSAVVFDEHGLPARMLGSHVDITERRRLEEHVADAQRLESLGTLAAGIAHDFNNLLGAIMGNLSLLRSAANSNDESGALLAELEDAARRATGLTQQLLTFSKGSAPVRAVLSVRDLLVETSTFVTRGSNVRCAYALADDLACLEADAGQLSQVINNLVINAMQAMPEGGTIHIGAENVTLRPGGPTGLPEGRYVHITVRDEGTGIPPEVLARIFDPFFTTKRSGSGLGLSSSHAIVTRHGGAITVSSTVGVGSTFDVYLPATDATPHPEPPTAVRPGTGRVLVMDDDPAIRHLFKRMLTRLGYEPVPCADGDEALRLYEEARHAGRPFDVVILDLTIPGDRGGAQIMPQLRQLDPDVRAIVASGYADNDVLSRHAEYGFRGRLQKPFDLATLGSEVARGLG